MNRFLMSFVYAVVSVCVFATPALVQAQAWPTKGPVRLVAVFPPGGSVDQVARILAPALQQALGQTVIVENKGGASGAIGAGDVARAEADGYTWGVVFDTHGVNPALQPRMAFDTRRDLATVALIGTSPMVISAHVDSPFKTWADVVAGSKGGRRANYGTIGNGSLGHLAVSLVSRSAGMDMVHVPYRGGGPLMQDAVAGHVPLAIGSVFVVKPHIDSGRLRALAVTTAQRSAALPGVPTLSELGFSNFEAPAWWAVIAPAKTPPDVIKRMNAEINKAMQLPDVAEKLSKQGIAVQLGTPEVAQRFVEGQLDIWAKVVREHDIKAD